MYSVIEFQSSWITLFLFVLKFYVTHESTPVETLNKVSAASLF